MTTARRGLAALGAAPQSLEGIWKRPRPVRDAAAGAEADDEVAGLHQGVDQRRQGVRLLEREHVAVTVAPTGPSTSASRSIPSMGSSPAG